MSLLPRMRNRAVLAATVLCLATTGLSLLPTHAADVDQPPSRVVAPAPLDSRPNILLISTDDQTVSDLRRMPQTRRLIGGAGATFTDMLSPHPLCCPARAEILTGQYTHNNGVRSNNRKWHGGHPYLRSSQTIATWLQDAGYATALVGKYLNQYGVADGREPGWDIWNPTVRRATKYYGYTMYNDGDPQTYDHAHNVDLVADKTVDYIRQLSAEDRPFFLWSSHVAPHMVCGGREGEGRCNGTPPVPRRHAGKFKKTKSPSLKKPSFNEKKMSDKPKFLRKKHKVKVGEINRIHRARIRSLLAVDEAVAAAVAELRRTGELDNTLILFTSDNGYLLGEHRYVSKDVPYEEALGVPLLMSGPGVPTGVTRKQTVTMVDLAATFMDAANASAALPLDGRSILPVAAGRSSGTQTVLIQSGPTRKSEIRFGWSYRGVRTARYTYVRWLATGFVELYDRAKDPFQMRNVAHDRRYKAVRKGLAKRYQQLRSCAGATCRTVFPALPPPRR